MLFCKAASFTQKTESCLLEFMRAHKSTECTRAHERTKSLVPVARPGQRNFADSKREWDREVICTCCIWIRCYISVWSKMFMIFFPLWQSYREFTKSFLDSQLKWMTTRYQSHTSSFLMCWLKHLRHLTGTIISVHNCLFSFHRL